uniref:Uncharacterized protein n=1 Tax=Meloidogyne enterolobii TaxID=390850 RepID=A0A6V7VQ39_MELEN|nr:unnamed protein product [Meloidogyne enterolobii]
MNSSPYDFSPRWLGVCISVQSSRIWLILVSFDTARWVLQLLFRLTIFTYFLKKLTGGGGGKPNKYRS